MRLRPRRPALLCCTIPGLFLGGSASAEQRAALRPDGEVEQAVQRVADVLGRTRQLDGPPQLAALVAPSGARP